MQSVLIISVMNGAAWGGSEELWYRSALWLAKNNYKVGICIYDWQGKIEKIEALKNAGCELYLLPGKNETRSITGKWKLYKAFKRIPFHSYQTAIINQGGWKDILSFPFRNLYKVLPSYCLCFHNYDAEERLAVRKLQALQKWIRKATVNMAASKKIFETISNFNVEISNQKIFINPISFYPPERQLPYPSIQEKIIFVMLAALDVKRKAQDILIQAFSKEKWEQRNWELHLYGAGPDHIELENMILTHKLQAKIFLKGFTGDVMQSLTPAHLVLQITHKDAMPISVMEAMAVGRPVIASNIGDMPEWIKDDETGWIVNKTEVESVNEILDLAWTHKNKWEAMGAKAFQTFQKRYPADPVKHFLYQCELL